jgi:hypothetical protein
MSDDVHNEIMKDGHRIRFMSILFFNSIMVSSQRLYESAQALYPIDFTGYAYDIVNEQMP